MCLLQIYGSYLCSSDLQYGFKERNGCNSAIYTVRSVVEYFTKHAPPSSTWPHLNSDGGLEEGEY